MDLESNHNISFTTRLPLCTPDSIISRILPMQDYTTTETMKVVSLFPLAFMLPQSFDSLTTFLLPSQVVVGVWNLMQRRALLFKWLEVVETMRAYIAHNMDGSEELRAKLKSVEGELAAARKIIDKGARLLRNTKNGRKTTKAKARRLAEEKKAMEAKH